MSSTQPASQIMDELDFLDDNYYGCNDDAIWENELTHALAEYPDLEEPHEPPGTQNPPASPVNANKMKKKVKKALSKPSPPYKYKIDSEDPKIKRAKRSKEFHESRKHDVEVAKKEFQKNFQQLRDVQTKTKNLFNLFNLLQQSLSPPLYINYQIPDAIGWAESYVDSLSKTAADLI